MKTIGLIGGLSWLSTVEYYRLMNQLVNEKLGGVASAKILLYSVNFEEIKALTVAGDWEGIAEIIGKIARNLELAGAGCMLLGANTMHRIADEIQARINIPLIHIATETAAAVKNKGINNVALLGTKYTMQLDFFKSKLAERQLASLIPAPAEIDYINNAIYSEMGAGNFFPSTRAHFISIIQKLVSEGAEGVIFGCTEIPILLKEDQFDVPVFDTTYIHAKAAVEFALS